MKLSIFILAAGLGERLRPITDHIPKPLIPILGKPVLQTILEKVSALSPDKIGINLHYKKEVIENWINQSTFRKSIQLFPEDPVLGTGGALKNAENFLKGTTFLVYNSDIISDIDLEKLVAFHRSSENLVTLAVHNYPEFNNLVIDEKGFLKGILHHPHPNPPPSMGRGIRGNPPSMGSVNKESLSSPCGSVNKESLSSPCGSVNKESSPSPCGRGRGGGGDRRVAFTGIAVYAPEFLKFLPAGTSSVVDAWLKTLSAGYSIGTFDVSGCYWTDIGTPASYTKAVINELRQNGETVYIHPSIEGCKQIELNGYVVIETQPNPPNLPLLKKGGGFLAGASLRNCIMLPESTPPSPPLDKGGIGGVFENCILGPGFKIDLSESAILGLKGDTDAILIGTGGSDRKYYRVKKNGRSAVLMQCKKDDPDYQRHIEYTAFFQKYSAPVPELIDAEPENMRAFFEDLGDLSLYSWLKCPREKVEIERIYKKVIDILVLLHTVATEHIFECPLLQGRVFDYDHLRWETSYFLERFIEGIKNIKIKNLPALHDEFHRLALKVDSFPKTIIHRDFQSQNIMITKGKIPRLLDYQSARIGPPAYDVVSILWDPYYQMDDILRERLLEYYISKMEIIPPNPAESPLTPLWKRGAGGDLIRGQEGIFEKDFIETILPCRLQRHMQALGAYGFLSKIKGKPYFLKYVPEGLRLLKDDVSLSRDEYPELYNLVMEL
ncbi:MAG: hypothetical protein FJ241_04915 [Nitrospira sp.]|nr:hypothetical protein [Nitrospira sp.]